jgi:predicted metal-binding protein
MSSKKSVLETAEQPWSTALVLVCSECDGGHGVELTNRLKDSVKAAGHKKDVRVARVRCLGICPKRGVAVTVTGADRTACSYVVHGKSDDAVDTLRDVILPQT